MSLTIGTQLGSYEITALLGKGGMGEVYRARDRKLKREVAIKILSDELSRSDDRVLRFQQEAEVLASLNHPNIAAIHDLQEEGSVRFLILELVEGETLDDALKRGVLSVDETLNIARQIADALEAAHGKGVIHRDLKTANIKLTPEGRVKVLDFGLAKAIRDPEMAFSNAETAAGMTGAGTILGTLAYMSPEQVRGETLDGRSDIFSFGIVLYEMIAGRHPFAATTAADTIAAILTSRPLAIADADALPVELRHVVSKCLEKDKTRRYQTAPEIVGQLNGIRTRLNGLPIHTAAGAPIPLPPVLGGTADSTAFVGRENERRSMVEAWDGSKHGKRRVILVGGEPGIGKTRLCVEFARQCGEENATVLVGRSDEHALIPYQPFIEALSWYVRMCPEADLLAHLSAIGGGAELGPLLPDLVRRVPELPVLAPMNPEGQRFRLFEAVSALLAAMSASRPTLVVFDDLHWADQPSLLMLRHIARSSESARLCLVGNYRESEVTLRHPLAEMLADLRSQPWVTRIVLTGLSDTQVADLVGSFAGHGTPRSLVQAVAENSGGNPFFIGEILRHLMETGGFAVLRDALAVRSADLGVPDGVRDVIRQRLSRLSEDCNRMLTLAAMIGQEFNLTLIEALSGLSEDRLLEVIEEAIRAQLVAEVRDGRDRCRFVHALIRETLYEELSGPRRSRWHRKIGEAIEQLTTHDPPLADLAYHFAEAAGTGVIDKAVEYAIRAGDRATGTLAHEEAARFYEMALRSLEAAPAGPETAARRLDIHTRRGRVFAAIAQWLPAKQEFERALENAGEKQIDRRCELLLGIFESSFWLGHEVAAVERIALEALSLAEQLPDRGDLAADAMAGSARCKIVSGDIPGAIALNRRAIVSAGGHRTMAHAFGPLPLYLAGLSAEAVAIGTEAARIAHYFTRHEFYDLCAAAFCDQPCGRRPVRRGKGRVQRSEGIRTQVWSRGAACPRDLVRGRIAPEHFRFQRRRRAAARVAGVGGWSGVPAALHQFGH